MAASSSDPVHPRVITPACASRSPIEFPVFFSHEWEMMVRAARTLASFCQTDASRMHSAEISGFTGFPSFKQPKPEISFFSLFSCDRSCTAGLNTCQRNIFAEKQSAKQDKAVECLNKDCEPLLVLFDFPAEYRDHLRTTNPN